MTTRMSQMHGVRAIHHRRTLNTHFDWSTEFTIELTSGARGTGSAPIGETPSLYEEHIKADPESVCSELMEATAGAILDQRSFDTVLQDHRDAWGQATVYALSVTFADAADSWPESSQATSWSPRLLVNVFNGALHAYTNPVFSDFPEFLLAPVTGVSVERQVEVTRVLLAESRLLLNELDTVSVNGNLVHTPPGEPNHAVMKLVRTLLADRDEANGFATWIDASASDMVTPHGYRLPVSGIDLSVEGIIEYWIEFAHEWGLSYLEDPFAERDGDAWRQLHERLPAGCKLVADNLVSGDLARLEEHQGALDAVLVKPDQCGTVTNTADLVAAARAANLEVMLSHRSVETDCLALVHLAAGLDIDLIKIGPFQGFAAVQKVNEILRAMGEARS
jgi:enolase